MNRLADETSPYLLQHADNPVDWWPWSRQAFEQARQRDVPVLLSVGYAACHWCHVMAHESFEDPRVAAQMNENFVNIKVDREERPDVDAVYMEATQALTRSGGWPMTCFLTPDGEPFYCGTYYPPSPRHGMPSFPQLLAAISETWVQRRSEVLTASADIVRALRAPLAGLPDDQGRVPDQELLGTAVQTLYERFDPEFAGFGSAPKFPPSMVLEFLLRHASRTRSPLATKMAERTFTAMASGGIYDQLGGGFARYAVDRGWVLPHFEKMLYDNALLLRAYLHWYRIGGHPTGERIARQTADFLLREMRTPEGGFASALDADSEGEEGKFYTWTREELARFPGAIETYGEGPTLRLLGADPDPELRRKLFEQREHRVRPGRDDKVVTAWNGLAISALTEAGLLLSEPAYTDAARTAAQLLVDLHTTVTARGTRLLRTSRGGHAGAGAGVLEDYANAAEAYLSMLTATGDPRWLRHAGELLDVVLDRFVENGHWYDTASDAEILVKRPEDPTDGPTPSGRFAAAGALLAYAAVTGSSRHRLAADDALGIATKLAARAPSACGAGLAVAEAMHAGPLEIAIVGESSADREPLFDVALRSASAGAVVVAGAPDDGRIPLLAGRGLVGGRAAGYVCRHFVCERPVTDPGELGERIAPWRNVDRG